MPQIDQYPSVARTTAAPAVEVDEGGAAPVSQGPAPRGKEGGPMAYRTFQDLKKRRSTALISWQRRESVRRTSALRLLLFGSVALALYFTTHWQQVVTPDEIGLKR